MIFKKYLAQLFDSDRIIRPKSLIITIMGDVVAVCGGEIWGGCLVEINKWYGISEESTRISLQRLVKEGWLVKVKKNNFTYYQFSLMAKNIYDLNQHHIYQKIEDNWKGGWQLIMILGDHLDFKFFIKEMEWQGYRKLTKNLFLLPEDESETARRLIEINELNEKVIWFSGKLLDLVNNTLIKKLVYDLWNTGNSLENHSKFVSSLLKITVDDLEKIKRSPQLSLYFRIYLIHEYRRLILRSPRLPKAIQLHHEIVDQMYGIVGRLYHSIEPVSQSYISHHLKSSKGTFVFSHKKDFYKRFSGPHLNTQQVKEAKKNIIQFSQKKLKTFIK